MKKLLPFSVSLLLLLSVSTKAQTTYTDLSENSIFYSAVSTLTDQGYLQGYDDGTFKAEEAVNRVEALKLILKSTHTESEASDTPLTFSDTDEKAWYVDDLKTALNLGIVQGNDDGTFRPENTVNQAEALKMLLLAANKKNALPNVSSDEWYTPYLTYGQENELIVPEEDGSYNPAKTLSRGELADLIYRFQNQPYQAGVEYGIASYYGRSFDGHPTASGTALDTEGYMCAHKTLPFGTKVRIININTNTYIDATVVDRGPYTPGYVVDLTPAAFEALAPLSTGILKVRLEVLK